MTNSNRSAAAVAPTLRPWASVPMWSLHKGEGQLTGEARIAALRAFRDTGCCEAWMVDPSDYGPDDAIETMGPNVGDIDWSGFPEADEADDDDSEEDDAEWLADQSAAAAAWVGDLGFEVEWESGTGDAQLIGVVRGDGERVILTNGDPVFEGDEGFEEAWEGAAWEYEGYWNAVIGADHTPASAVREFELEGSSRRDLDEWLGGGEAEARVMGAKFGVGVGGAFHERALDALVAASTLYVVWGDGPCDLVDQPQPELQVYTPWSDRDLEGAEWVGVFCGSDTSYLDREPNVTGYRELREHEITEWRSTVAINDDVER